MSFARTMPEPRLRPRLLVVDNEPSFATIVRRILGRNHEIESCADAQIAYDWIAKGERFDVILCDLLMPDMSGSELYRRLVAVAPRQAQRIIFMTGAADLPETRVFLTDVPNLALRKPFTSRALRAAVHTTSGGLT